ncbi:DUF2079 domain-containing protein [Thermodesulfobacteriota bacterium]
MLLTSIILYTLILSALAIGRYRSFFCYEFEDSACYHQAIWNAARGHLLSATTSLRCQTGRYFPSVWLALLPLYALRPSPTTLMVLKTLFIGLGAVPVYLIARLWIRGSWLPLFFSILYLFQPLLHYQNLSYFRPSRLAPTLFLFMVYLFLKARPLLFTIVSFAAIGCRPETAFIIGAIGVWALFFKQRRHWSPYLLIGSAVAYLVVTQIIMPNVYGFDYNKSQLAGNFGDDQLVLGFSETGRLVERMVTNLLHGDVGVWFRNLWGWQFLPFLISPYSLLSGPGILAAALLHRGMIQNNHLHHLAPIFPFVFLGMMHGCARLLKRVDESGTPRRRGPRYIVSAGIAFLVLGTFFQIIGDNIPGNVNARGFPMKDLRFEDQLNLYDPIYTTLDEADRTAWDFIRQIPLDASVTATGDLLWALSSRRELYEFGCDQERLPATDYVLANSRNLYIGAGRYCILSPAEQAELVRKILDTGRYELTGDREGFKLLKRREAQESN